MAYGPDTAELLRLVKSQKIYLDISHLNVRSLPELGPDLVSLNCGNCELETLPKLPENLEELNCINNKLTALPELPYNLQNLYCSHNPISTVTPPFPPGIRNKKMSDVFSDTKLEYGDETLGEWEAAPLLKAAFEEIKNASTAYTSETNVFRVVSAKVFEDGTVFEAIEFILDMLSGLCKEGIGRNYIEHSIFTGEHAYSHGWIGFLLNTPSIDAPMTSDNIVGVIMFEDMRPDKPIVIRKFICGRKMGATLNNFFEEHIRKGPLPVTVYLRSILVSDGPADKVLTFHQSMGYEITQGNPLGDKEDDEYDEDDPNNTVLMSKTIGGTRRSRARTRRTRSRKNRKGRHTRRAFF